MQHDRSINYILKSECIEWERTKVKNEVERFKGGKIKIIKWLVGFAIEEERVKREEKGLRTINRENGRNDPKARGRCCGVKRDHREQIKRKWRETGTNRGVNDLKPRTRTKNQELA